MAEDLNADQGGSMSYDEAADQLVRDKIQEHLGRPATQAEIDHYGSTSEWALMDYIRHFNGGRDYLAHSQEAVQAHDKILQLLDVILPGQPVHPDFITHAVRENWSIEHVMQSIRAHPMYQAMYKDKPAQMDEAEYRQRAEKMNFEQAQARQVWYKWTGKMMTDDELRRAYIQDDSAEHRNYGKYRGWEIAVDTMNKDKGSNALVRLGPGGPQQMGYKSWQSQQAGSQQPSPNVPSAQPAGGVPGPAESYNPSLPGIAQVPQDIVATTEALKLANKKVA